MAGKSNAKLNVRGVEAAARFLECRGYDVIDKHLDGYVDIVAECGDELVFVKVAVSRKSAPSYGNPAAMRASFEAAAASYLATSDAVDMRVRFDTVGLLVIEDGKALLKHHVNACEAGAACRWPDCPYVA